MTSTVARPKPALVGHEECPVTPRSESETIPTRKRESWDSIRSEMHPVDVVLVELLRSVPEDATGMSASLSPFHSAWRSLLEAMLLLRRAMPVGPFV